MGRHNKIVKCEKIDRRENGYYSTPSFVAEFITNTMLSINPNGKAVLDPCVGKEELLDKFYESGKKIDSLDIDGYKEYTKSKFERTNFIDLYKKIFDSRNSMFSKNISLPYDYYIANPPYNCHETNYIKDNKDTLKKIFPRVGTLNMYSMFLSAIINIAKDGATIGIITHDSFLTARLHKELRKEILNKCSIHYLLLCPTDLFLKQKADVRTCIIVMRKGKQFQGKVATLNRPNKTSEFKQALTERAFKFENLEDILLNGKKDLMEFVIGCPPEIKSLFNNKRIGDLFKCVTGISTGNDKKYISKTKTDYFTVPFFKNPGSKRFRCDVPDGFLPKDFLSIDKDVKNFMVRNKDILFKKGIACSSMGVPFTASYLPPKSTFGVNPNIICNESDIWWLLSYLNSSLVTFFVRGILLRSNMITSGYVSRIPVVEIPNELKGKLAKIGKEAYETGSAETYRMSIKKIDSILFDHLNLNARVINIIKKFTKTIIQST